MFPITAWQHIYSNVEKAQSPHGRGGFQTLFYTHAGLTEAEVEEMESRLLYFPSTGEPVKRLFFTTSTGKGVVGQIVFLPSPDQFGRGGRYLAHSLVFAAEALAKFEADPFRVFQRFSFVTTLDEALARGDFGTGDIPPLSLDLPASLSGEVEAARQWPAAELNKLALLALRAEPQARRREAITLAGAPEEIETALAAALLAVPTARRPACSFDTYFYRCNLVATYFWAIGLPEPPVSIKFVLVRAAARQVRGEVTTQPATAYERWALAAIDAGHLAGLARQRDQAFALAEWLDGWSYELAHLEAAPPELIRELFELNPDAVRAALQRQVNRYLPPALVERGTDTIYRRESQAAVYRHLRQGLDLPVLLAVLYESYEAEAFKEPSRAEIKALVELLQQSEHPLLSLVVTCWTGSEKQLGLALERVEETVYRQFVERALRFEVSKPLKLLVPGQGETFLELYRPTQPTEIVALIEALLVTGQAACLTDMQGHLSRLSNRQLKKLTKLLDQQAETPESFRAAMDQALARQSSNKGFGKILRTVLRRRSGEE